MSISCLSKNNWNLEVALELQVVLCSRQKSWLDFFIKFGRWNIMKRLWERHNISGLCSLLHLLWHLRMWVLPLLCIYWCLHTYLYSGFRTTLYRRNLLWRNTSVVAQCDPRVFSGTGDWTWINPEYCSHWFNLFVRFDIF